MKRIGLLLLAGAALVTIGCQHANRLSLANENKIRVTVLGDVHQPGTYLVDSASLGSIESTVGGVCADQAASPQQANVYRMVDGRKQSFTYDIIRMNAHQKEAVRLQDGDLVVYPQTIVQQAASLPRE